MSKVAEPQAHAARPKRPRQHRFEVDPPPPVDLHTVEQEEEKHKALKGRLRQMIARADAGDPTFDWLRYCIIRIGRSVFIDDVMFRQSLREHAAIPPAPSRNAAPRSRDKAAA